MFFAGDASRPEEQRLLSSMVERYAEIRKQDAKLRLVLACSRHQAEQIKRHAQASFPVLLDEGAQIHKTVAAIAGQTGFAPAVYMTDRFMEVYAAWRTD